jgi:putative membrane protein
MPNVNKGPSMSEDNTDTQARLAADRTVFAAERTYAAWVRTGLAALASGVGAKALLTGVVPTWLGQLTGTLLVLFSAFCFVAAVWRELVVVNPRPDAPRIPSLLFFLMNGMLAITSIAALVGMWLR